eukprot:315258_1
MFHDDPVNSNLAMMVMTPKKKIYGPQPYLAEEYEDWTLVKYKKHFNAKEFIQKALQIKYKDCEIENENYEICCILTENIKSKHRKNEDHIMAYQMEHLFDYIEEENIIRYNIFRRYTEVNYPNDRFTTKTDMDSWNSYAGLPLYLWVENDTLKSLIDENINTELDMCDADWRNNDENDDDEDDDCYMFKKYIQHIYRIKANNKIESIAKSKWNQYKPYRYNEKIIMTVNYTTPGVYHFSS